MTNAIADHGHSPALLDKLTALETQEYELNDELARLDILLQAKPEPLSPSRIQRLAEHFEAILSTGSPEEQRKALAGWIPKLLAERQDKRSILVYMEVYVPPLPGPDPPAGRRKLTQHPPSAWGHCNTDNIHAKGSPESTGDPFFLQRTCR